MSSSSTVTVTATATLTDPNTGNGLPNQNVAFSIAVSGQTPTAWGTKKTDSSGVAVMSGSQPKGPVYDIEANYKGATIGTIKYNSATGSFTLDTSGGAQAGSFAVVVTDSKTAAPIVKGQVRRLPSPLAIYALDATGTAQVPITSSGLLGKMGGGGMSSSSVLVQAPGYVPKRVTFNPAPTDGSVQAVTLDPMPSAVATIATPIQSAAEGVSQSISGGIGSKKA